MRMRITHAVATPTFDRREMLLRRVSLSLAVASGWRRLSSDVRAVSGSMKLHRSLLMLGLGQHAEPGQVKEAYLELAKVYHPDSGSAQASHHKFIQIREAYVVCMGHAKRVAVTEQLYQALEQELEEMEQSLGYRRRLLPHRHYLEHDAPHGTPSQRQREAAQSRLNRAIDNVYERQFQKALQQSSEVTEVKPHPSGEVVGVAATPEERLLRKRSLKRSSAPLQHIADERIMEEMRAGGFQAIRGKGAPIRTEPATHMLDNLDEKLNKVLINSGCVPEWISLDKEIRESVGRLKAAVRMAWLKYRSTSPPSRLAEQRWQEEREHFQLRVTNINEMIRKLNFEVPCLHMQRMPLRLDSFVERVTREVDTPPPGHGQEHVGQCETSSDSDQLWTESLSEQAVNLSDSSGSVSGEVRSQLHTLQHNTPNPSSVEESSFFGFISSLIQRFIISRQTKL